MSLSRTENELRAYDFFKFVLLLVLLKIFTTLLSAERPEVAANGAGSGRSAKTQVLEQIRQDPNARTVEGAGTAGALISLKSGDQVYGTATVGNNSLWQISVPKLSAVIQKWTVTMVKGGKLLAQKEITNQIPAGNPMTSEPAANGAKPTIPASASKFSITQPSNNASISVGKCTIRGTGIPGSIVKLTLDQWLLTYVTVSNDGKWSFETAVETPKQPRMLRAVQFDRQKKKLAETTVSLSVFR